MESKSRATLATGLVLIVLGAWFLAVRVVPGLEAWAGQTFAWPLIIVAVGLMLLLIGMATGAYAMAVPAMIVGGIGGLLYWQNATGQWESWAYAWTLIPGFVGLGIGLAALLEGERGERLQSAGWLVLISAVLFFIFGSFLGGADLFGPYWPLLLVGLGALLLLQSLRGPRRA